MDQVILFSDRIERFVSGFEGQAWAIRSPVSYNMDMESTTELPSCKLIGSDGNVFSIIGAVSSTLKRAGLKVKANEFTERAFAASSYEEVLAMLHDYVEVE